MNEMVKTTLLISTYNWKDALRLCLYSASLQTVIPDEIVIADDGSREDTRELIDSFRSKIKVPIVHVWQEDNGFRKTSILNKAVAKSSGDYIIQIDGDVVMEHHFIQDHLEMMEENYFVCGSRTKLGAMVTNRLIENVSLRIKIFEYKPAFVFNGLRMRTLRSYLAKRYAKRVDHMRGCNFAFWRKDFIAVNGYNENLESWGHEDGELVYRLHFNGVEKKVVKMGGIVFHLWHKESPRSAECFHLKTLDAVKQNRISWSDNGINKYLSLQQ